METSSTRVGLDVKNRSRIWLPRVGWVTTCSRRQSSKTSRHSIESGALAIGHRCSGLPIYFQGNVEFCLP